MNKLSSDRLYSVSQPAKNCRAAAGSPIQPSPRPNTTASATTAAVHSADSRSPGR